MIVRTLDEAAKSERRVVSKGWESTRMLLKNDGMGFSFHITTIYAGADLEMHYQNHLESVYCISGEGEIEDRADGKIFSIRPGTIYALDKHDKHILRAATEMKMACVFNPPLNGKEVHNEQGAYELQIEEVPDWGLFNQHEKNGNREEQ
jgi:L-ectoine synthase